MKELDSDHAVMCVTGNFMLLSKHFNQTKIHLHWNVYIPPLKYENNRNKTIYGFNLFMMPLLSGIKMFFKKSPSIYISLNIVIDNTWSVTLNLCFILSILMKDGYSGCLFFCLNAADKMIEIS